MPNSWVRLALHKFVKSFWGDLGNSYTTLGIFLTNLQFPTKITQLLRVYTDVKYDQKVQPLVWLKY